MPKILDKIPRRFRSKRAVRIYAVSAVLFLLLNVFIGLRYSSSTFPNTTIAGQKFGSVSEQEITSKLEGMTLLPEKVTLIYKDKETETTPDELGIQVDAEKTQTAIMEDRSWFPLANYFGSHEVAFASTTDNAKLDAYVKAFTKKRQQKPTNAKIALKDGSFSAVSEKTGHTLDTKIAVQTIVDSIASGQTRVDLEPKELPASTTTADVNKRIETIKKQQQTQVTLKYKDKTKTFTPAEIALWYEIEGPKAELADANIQGAITQAGSSFGILVKNLQPSVSAAKAAVEKGEATSITLVAAPKPTKAFTYCTAVKGVSTSYLGGLQNKLASVFADSRGWGLGGQVSLTRATSGCDFTVWLTESSQMPSFGAICDTTWSCRVGPNVVINFARWQNASPAWNANGGSLNDYRSMVINHETGHWFGFYHKFCGGAGQAAPVMQQQSIDLQGCKFNPWPTAAERAELKRSLGL